MKALVLTFDRYRPLTENMILEYRRLYSDHPFEFLIPFQDNNNRGRIPADEKVRFVRSEKEILPTVFTLLDECDTDEIVYWCIDDKYPTWVDRASMNRILQLVDTNDIRSFCPCRCRGLYRREYLTKPESANPGPGPRGDSLLIRKSYSGIWLHQLIPVSVLRGIFGRFRSNIRNAKEMDAELDALQFTETEDMYVARRSIITFAESTTRGKITMNCAKSLKRRGITIPPDFRVSNRSIYLGKRWGFYEAIYYSSVFRNARRVLAKATRGPRLLLGKLRRLPGE